MKFHIRDDDYDLRMTNDDFGVFYKLQAYVEKYYFGFVLYPGKQYFLYSKSSEKTPINNDLIDLYNKFKKKIVIAIHGINHSVVNSIPEFERNQNFFELKEVKETVEKLFNIEVDCFSPPNNSLSMINFKLLKKVGFKQFFHAFGFKLFERPLNWIYLKYYIKNAFLVLFRKKYLRSSCCIEYLGVKEVPTLIYYDIDGTEKLKEAIKYFKRKGCQTVVIAIHNWEIDQKMINELVSIFKEFGNYE